MGFDIADLMPGKPPSSIQSGNHSISIPTNNNGALSSLLGLNSEGASGGFPF